jgi:hypothetical protein
MVSMDDWFHSYFSTTTTTTNSISRESMAAQTFQRNLVCTLVDTVFGFANGHRSRVAFQLEFSAYPKGFFLPSGSILQNLWQHTRVFHDFLLSHRTMKRTLDARTPQFDSASATNQPTNLANTSGIKQFIRPNKWSSCVSFCRLIDIVG